MISSSFRRGVKLFNTVEVPQYVKFAGTKTHVKSLLGKIGREYGLQPEILEGKFEHSVIYKSDFAVFKTYVEAIS